MTTPYDAALRLGRRDMDDRRVSISSQIEQLAALERHRDAVDKAVHEARHTTDMPYGLSSDAYMARMRARRQALLQERAAAESHLGELRRQATEAFGALNAIEGAALRHRDAAARAAATAEQGQIDDFSAARFTRAQHDARRSRDRVDHSTP